MERISNVIELKEDDFHYNVYNELKEMYKERTNYSDRYVDFDDFKDEYLEYVKDDSNENFEKYNSNCNYHIIILGSVECKLYMLKKDFLEIKKDNYVFMIKNLWSSCIIMFYLKEDSKNIELAKDVWINELNYGNFKCKNKYIRGDDNREKVVWEWDSFEIKNKEKYIKKCFTFNSYTQIIAQTKFVIEEVKL